MWELIDAAVFSVRPRLAIQSLHLKGVDSYRDPKTQIGLCGESSKRVAARTQGCFYIHCVYISVLLIIQLIGPVKDRWEKIVNQKGEHSGERSSTLKQRTPSSSPSPPRLPGGSETHLLKPTREGVSSSTHFYKLEAFNERRPIVFSGEGRTSRYSPTFRTASLTVIHWIMTQTGFKIWTTHLLNLHC